MSPHKFKAGDIVALKLAMNRFAPSDVFEVIKQLPGSNEPEYRIKSANELHQRVVRESELIKAYAPYGPEPISYLATLRASSTCCASNAGVANARAATASAG